MSYDIAQNFRFIAAKNLARTAQLTLDTLDEGQAVLVDNAGNILVANNVAAATELKIAVKKDGNYYETPYLKPEEIRFYGVKPQVDKKNLIMYIGYDPVLATGQLEGDANVVDNTAYVITVRRNQIRDKAVTDCIYYNKAVGHTTGINATEQSLAAGLATAFAASYPATGWGSDLDGWINTELISSVGTTVATQTLTVIRGANTVTTTQSLTVGSYIRIGYNEQTGVPEAYATKHGVYKVMASLGSNVYKLDRPVVATSATYTTAQWGTITNAAAAAGSWGIKLIGQNKIFDAGRFGFDVFTATAWLGANFVNTPEPTTATLPILGHGMGQEVVETEWEAEHEERYGQSENSHPPKSYVRILNSEEGVNYNIVSIQYQKGTDFFAAGFHNIIGHAQVALPISTATGANQADYQADSLKPVGIVYGLDTWLTAKTSNTYNEEAKLT